ncbi:hypothetical protein C8046_09535 [Serinibacter arcticus]|uniref:Uncharacterized protein n=1 Tax=Serinibacter arcticus TaxID=1655435 RepID=A0A2U1ZV43_9MICO|nr:hypothetical protein [Serinibacter arcticus]PWD50856.1 hypothetical protein C8046_09535 [Serinibacter arcticus]
MSDVDTEITGSPSSIRGTVTWLRDTLAPAVQAAADDLTSARLLASEGWQATAGYAFWSTATRAIRTTDDLESSVRSLADDVDDFATSLERCLEDMRQARNDARDGDLVVNTYIVRDPGPGPAFPTMPTDSADTQAYDTYWQADAAYQAHQEKVRVFIAVRAEADRVDRAYRTACEKLNGDITPGAHASWMVTIGEILGDGVVARYAIDLAQQAHALNTRADELFAMGQQQLDDIANNSGFWDRRYRNISWLPGWLDQSRIEADRLAAQGLMDQADDLRTQAANLEPGRTSRIFRTAGKILGPLGLGLGVYNDWQEGESVEQIAVSQGGSAALGALAGIGAAAGTGALIGSVVPGVGTAVGAVVGTVIGAGVAIFADGAIDSFFENGPDVGEAWNSGVEALGDTAEAIGDFGGSVVSTVGGWFD